MHIISAQRMRGILSPFVRLRCDGAGSVRTRQDDDGGEEPTWNEHFMLPLRVRAEETPMVHVDVVDATGRTLTTLLPVLALVTSEGHIHEGTFLWSTLTAVRAKKARRDPAVHAVDQR